MSVCSVIVATSALIVAVILPILLVSEKFSCKEEVSTQDRAQVGFHSVFPDVIQYPLHLAAPATLNQT